MTPELLLALVSGRSIALAEPVGGKRPEWTVIEAGWGLSRLQSCYDAAFRYRHGRDPSVYWRLHRFLWDEAMRTSWESKWKRKVAGRYYLNDLVALVLAEEWLSNLDRQRLVLRLTGSWPEGVYEREIQPKQRTVAMILDRWCSAAHEHIQHRIRCDAYDDGYADVDREAELA